MRNKFGTLLMILGAALMTAALSLFLYNQREAAEAEKTSAELIPQLTAVIEENKTAAPEQTAEVPNTPAELLDPSELVMTEVEINGYAYVGCLSIPALDLQLPVMSGWDDTRLKMAPCRYAGSVKGEDLVVMAHNYAYHFGRISELSPGDSVIFTDMDGGVYQYEVVARDVLLPTAVEEMTAGNFDLTLFTCTYGGQSRVTVYCDLVKD